MEISFDLSSDLNGSLVGGRLIKRQTDTKASCSVCIKENYGGLVDLNEYQFGRLIVHASSCV